MLITGCFRLVESSVMCRCLSLDVRHGFGSRSAAMGQVEGPVSKGVTYLHHSFGEISRMATAAKKAPAKKAAKKAVAKKSAAKKPAAKKASKKPAAKKAGKK